MALMASSMRRRVVGVVERYRNIADVQMLPPAAAATPISCSRFGVRSRRIGMAQELALAGFGLSMIMQASRWTDPKMPRYYIRELKVHESAAAELHRMIAKGSHKVYGEAKGYDIVCAFHVLKYGR